MDNQNYEINYKNFYDLMSSRYEFSDEEIKSLTERFPNLSDYKNLDLINKLDFLEFFNVTKAQILENPKFLFKQAHILVNKCKLAYILGFEPTAEYLNSYFNLRFVLTNMKAVDSGQLPKNTNVFLPIKATSGFANFNNNESYLMRNKVGGVNWEINDRFEKLYPELSLDLNKYFPQFAYNQEKSQQFRRISDKEQSRKNVKSLIKELWAKGEMKGRNRAGKVSFVANSYDNVVYSTESHEVPKRTIVVEKAHQQKEPVFIEQELFEQKTINTQNQINVNEKTEPSMADVETFVSSAKKQAQQAQRASTLSNLAYYQFKYNIPCDEIERKMNFYNQAFGMSEKDFFWKLDKTSHFITASNQRILNAKELLENEVGFSGKVLHDYVLYTPTFPSIEKSIESMKEKVNMLNSLGIKNELISLNFNILKRSKEDLELRAKLAFINDLPVETFIKDGHFFSPKVIWSRMQAYKQGKINSDKFYVDGEEAYNNIHYRVGELIDMYPLTNNDLNEINNQFESLVQEGKTWRNSYKLSLKNSHEFQEIQTPKTFDSEESKSLIAEIQGFSDDVLSFEQEPEMLNIEEALSSDDTSLKLMNLFDCSITEVEKLVKKHPRLIKLDFNKVNELKNYLLETLNITSDDFAQAIRVNPSLVRKSIKQFEAYKTFLSEYLLFDKKQIKQALTHSGNAIIKDPEDILEKTYIFARTLKIPFKRAAEIFIESPAAYQSKIDKLEERLKTLLSLGIDKETLTSNLNIASCTNKNVKIKYMLAKLNGLSNEEFLKRNYFINEAKVYARTMFNLTYNENLSVYDSEKSYKRNLEEIFSHLEHMPSFVTEDEPSLALKELYPFGETQKKQIENLYNTKFHKNPLKLNEEELEYGN